MHEQPLTLALEESAEQTSSDSLYESSKLEVFKFGDVEGTLDDLIKLCPVPPEQMTPEAKDLFVAKIYVASGKEIPEHFAHLRPENIEKPSSAKETVESDSKKEIIQPKIVEKPAPAQPRLTAQTIDSVNEKSETIIQEPVPRELPIEFVHPPETISPESTEQQLAEQLRLISKPAFASEALEPVAVPSTPPKPVESAPTQLSITTIGPEDSTEHKEVGLVVKRSEAQEKPVVQLLGELFQEAVVEADSTQYVEPLTLYADFTEEVDPIAAPEVFEGRILSLPPVMGEMYEANAVAGGLELLAEAPPVIQRTGLEVLEQALPPSMHLELAQQLEVGNQSVAEQAIKLFEAMAPIVERLQVLETSDDASEGEVAAIEMVLEAYFEELVVLLGVEITAEARATFIADLKKVELTVADIEDELPFVDWMHERIASIVTSLGSAQSMPSSVHARIGHFILAAQTGLQPLLAA